MVEIWAVYDPTSEKARDDKDKEVKYQKDLKYLVNRTKNECNDSNFLFKQIVIKFESKEEWDLFLKSQFQIINKNLIRCSKIDGTYKLFVVALEFKDDLLSTGSFNTESVELDITSFIDTKQIQLEKVPHNSHIWVKSVKQASDGLCFYENLVLLHNPHIKQSVVLEIKQEGSCEEVTRLYNSGLGIKAEQYVDTGYGISGLQTNEWKNLILNNKKDSESLNCLFKTYSEEDLWNLELILKAMEG